VQRGAERERAVAIVGRVGGGHDRGGDVSQPGIARARRQELVPGGAGQREVEDEQVGDTAVGAREPAHRLRPVADDLHLAARQALGERTPQQPRLQLVVFDDQDQRTAMGAIDGHRFGVLP
jgi:hypothetical protein